MTDVADTQNWLETFKQETSENKVFLYAKGEKGAPACGFSNQVMQIFGVLGVDYKVRNILADPRIRQELSVWTQWPTIPQVFIDGEFVGGCDILTEMYETGELQKKLGLA
jgi:monothiol glutaredoxin